MVTSICAVAPHLQLSQVRGNDGRVRVSAARRIRTALLPTAARIRTAVGIDAPDRVEAAELLPIGFDEGLPRLQAERVRRQAGLVVQVVPEDVVAERRVVAREEDEGVPHLVHLSRSHRHAPVPQGNEHEVLAELVDSFLDDLLRQLASGEKLLPHLGKRIPSNPPNRFLFVDFHFSSRC
jgi:hypothetical protein